MWHGDCAWGDEMRFADLVSLFGSAVSDASGLGDPEHEFMNAGCRMAAGNQAKRVGEPAKRVDTRKLAGLDERGEPNSTKPHFLCKHGLMAAIDRRLLPWCFAGSLSLAGP